MIDQSNGEEKQRVGQRGKKAKLSEDGRNEDKVGKPRTMGRVETHVRSLLNLG